MKKLILVEQEVITCDFCGETIAPEETLSLGEKELCGLCFSEVLDCACCGEWFMEVNMFFDEKNDTYYCKDCLRSTVIQQQEAKLNEMKLFVK